MKFKQVVGQDLMGKVLTVLLLIWGLRVSVNGFRQLWHAHEMDPAMILFVVVIAWGPAGIIYSYRRASMTRETNRQLSTVKGP